ncbi:MAG: FMN-binding protein [Actinomycetota bacterium]|nr:FMN-binding protein [Actinomycetota bacterium]
MNTPRTPRNQAPIDPLLRLQQLDRSRQQQLPPPTAGTVRQPTTTRQAADARRTSSPAPRQSAPTATTLLPSGVKPSAQASARIAALAAARGTVSGPGKASSARGGKPVGKRAKPARAAKVASLALSAVTTIGLAGMFADQNSQTDSIVLTQGTIGTVAATTATTTAPAATVPGNTATTVATTAPPVATGQVLDGTYVGAGDSNRWGTVQVQAVYSSGQLVDVQILQYPDGDGKSVRINQRALPTLINASITSQSANVSTVSGATYTSDSYTTSLQSAIDAAKAASGING